MRSAIVAYGLGFLALSGCASAPGYRSSAVRPPASFRGTTDSGGTGPAPYISTAPGPEGPHSVTPSPEGSSPPDPLSRWERGNEGRARGLDRLLGSAGRYHAVPPC